MNFEFWYISVCTIWKKQMPSTSFYLTSVQKPLKINVHNSLVMILCDFPLAEICNMFIFLNDQWLTKTCICFQNIPLAFIILMKYIQKYTMRCTKENRTKGWFWLYFLLFFKKVSSIKFLLGFNCFEPLKASRWNITDSHLKNQYVYKWFLISYHFKSELCSLACGDSIMDPNVPLIFQ